MTTVVRDQKDRCRYRGKAEQKQQDIKYIVADKVHRLIDAVDGEQYQHHN
jgi:hypothetical protein